MKPSLIGSRLLCYLLFYTFSSLLQAQEKSIEFIPLIGQDGKDVIWVPTPYQLVNKMLEIAEVTDKDYLIDLGSGDGRTVIAAAKLGAYALGIEFNPDMVQLAKKNADEAGVNLKTKFVEADLFGYDISDATVITMFLLPEINLKLRPLLLDLKPGTRVVSNTFNMGNWEPDYEVVTENNMESWYTALMWIVPAKINGIWTMEDGELNIDQEFQFFYGTYKSKNNTSIIKEGRLTGNELTFCLDGAKYTGKVTSDKIISGTVEMASEKKKWIARLKQ